MSFSAAASESEKNRNRCLFCSTQATFTFISFDFPLRPSRTHTPSSQSSALLVLSLLVIASPKMRLNHVLTSALYSSAVFLGESHADEVDDAAESSTTLAESATSSILERPTFTVR